MYSIRFYIQNLDIYRLDSDKYFVDIKEILPPLKSIEGLGENVAIEIIKKYI